MSGLSVPETWQDVEKAIDALSGKQILFVAGAVKSGTTWTQLWLDRHPEVACRGEGYFFNKFAGALQKLCNDTSLMTQHQNNSKGATLPDFPSLTLPVVQYLLRQTVLSCLSAYGAGPEIKVVAEKTPSTSIALEAVFLVFPEARVLNLVRDGRDVAVSAWHANLRRGGDDFLKVFPTFTDFVPEIAQIWVNHHTPVLQKKPDHPGQIRQIHYEQLIAEPGSVMGNTFEWLEVDSSEAVLEDCLQATTFETLSGGRKPGEEDRDSFFRKGTAAQWRDEMTDAQEALFWSIAGPTMEAQGYDRGGDLALTA